MDFSEEQALETYKSMISIGTEAMEGLQLINGGAVVALLAYIGQAKDGAKLATRIDTPVAWFLAGLVAATLTFVLTYLTQFRLLNELRRPAEVKQGTHIIWLFITIGFAVLSILFFSIGSYAAVCALKG